MAKNKTIKKETINDLCSNDIEEISFKDEPDIKGKEIASFSFNDDESS